MTCAGRADNHIFDWEAGEAARADEVFAAADVTVAEDLLYPRVHPAPLETCGAIADFDVISGKLTVWSTTPGAARRTGLLYAMVTGVPEHKIRVISPDIGGGFGNKVRHLPRLRVRHRGLDDHGPAGQVDRGPVREPDVAPRSPATTTCTGRSPRPGTARSWPSGYEVLADHGAFNGAAQPTKFPAGFFGVFTGSYDLQAAHCQVTGVYTNKAPGGVAYACSFRITEAVYLVERMVDCLAFELDIDPAELRMKNLLRPDQFPYTCATGWEYDSGDYRTRPPAGHAHRRATPELRREQAARRERGELMGIGISLLHRGGRGRPAQAHGHPRPGHGRRRGAAGAPDRQGRAAHRGADPGPGPRDDVRPDRRARSSGIPPDDIEVVHGDTDRHPFGLGTYGSRSTPVSGAAAAVAARRVRDKARVVAAAMLEVSADDLEWEKGRWLVQGRPRPGPTDRRDRAGRPRRPGAARRSRGPPGRVSCVYNPPNLTYPFGAYICVVDVDPGTGKVNVRRFIAVDDCGARINPMIVEGQIHGGLADGVGMALMEVITFDSDGNCLGGSFMDYLLPTAMECPSLGAGGDRHPLAAPPDRGQGRG